MLQYLIILLDDTSVSFCHYDCTKKDRHLISLDNLRKGIFFGMKENLMIQFVYPDYDLPQEYKDVIETVDHSKIKPSYGDTREANVIVFDKLEKAASYSYDSSKTYVLRLSKKELFSNSSIIEKLLEKVTRLNLVISDVDKFTLVDFEKYRFCLTEWVGKLERLYAMGASPQLNVLTDRMLLNEINSCGAGDTSITLAPDGNFYICPGFYFDSTVDGTEKTLGDVCKKGYRVGSLDDGMEIKNSQLYKITHAPLCRKCDAYQCKRCIWLNRKTTLEVNIPSHEQCVVAHLERNASRDLLDAIRKYGVFLPDMEIKEILYLDPFDVKDEN